MTNPYAEADARQHQREKEDHEYDLRIERAMSDPKCFVAFMQNAEIEQHDKVLELLAPFLVGAHLNNEGFADSAMRARNNVSAIFHAWLTAPGDPYTHLERWERGDY